MSLVCNLASASSSNLIGTTICGANTGDYNDGINGSIRLHFPSRGCIDPFGNFVFADQANSVIRRVNCFGKIGLVAGKPIGAGKNDGNCNDAKFYWPSDVCCVSKKALKTKQNLFPEFTFTSYWKQHDTPKSREVYVKPESFLIDGPDYLVADEYNHSLRLISGEGLVTTLAGSGACGSADGASSDAQFFDPKGVCVIDNSVYLTDASNESIRLVQFNKVSTFYQWKHDSLHHKPTGICSFGEHILVADSNAHCIYKLSVTGGCEIFSGIPFQAGHLDGDKPLYDSPSSVCVDNFGNILVADSNNHCIRVISNKTGLVSTVDRSIIALNYPSGVSYDHRFGGILYVTDHNSIKVIRLQDKFTNWLRRSPWIFARCKIYEFGQPKISPICDDDIYSPPNVLPLDKFDALLKQYPGGVVGSGGNSIADIVADEAFQSRNARKKSNCVFKRLMLLDNETIFRKILLFV